MSELAQLRSHQSMASMQILACSAAAAACRCALTHSYKGVLFAVHAHTTCYSPIWCMPLIGPRQRGNTCSNLVVLWHCRCAVPVTQQLCIDMMPAEGDAGASGRSGRKSRANAGARLKDILQQEAKDLRVSSSSMQNAGWISKRWEASTASTTCGADADYLWRDRHADGHGMQYQQP